MTELFTPLFEYSFMQRALLGVVLVAISAPLMGIFLVLRRMSLAADSLAHAVFPGVAAGFLLFGPSLIAMSIGGLLAGLLVAILTGVVSRTSIMREDACLVSLYVIAIALGVTLLSFKNTSIDIMALLFGSVLGLDDGALIMLAGVAAITLVFLALFHRPLVMDSVDPVFIRSFSNMGGITHVIFLVVVMLNLVAGLQALGALLAVGTMMLPAVTALLWTHKIKCMAIIASGLSLVANVIGLLISYHFNLPAGPAMILVSGCFYVGSLLFIMVRPKFQQA